MFAGRVVFLPVFACAALLWPGSVAVAADATLFIKARLVRCITQAERHTMCDSENLCCDLINGSQGPEATRVSYTLPPSSDAVWIGGRPANALLQKEKMRFSREGPDS